MGITLVNPDLPGCPGLVTNAEQLSELSCQLPQCLWVNPIWSLGLGSNGSQTGRSLLPPGLQVSTAPCPCVLAQGLVALRITDLSVKD